MQQNSQTEKFNEILNALNEEQLNAVKLIEGPIMITAGPGTGKTQILAARIANILLQTDALPENILCLTYTEAGTIAMRKRLNQFIGSTSYRVAIHTFHGFCNLVIQENLDVFGFRNLDPISELERIQLLREMVDNLPKNNPLKRYTGDAYYEVYRLIRLYDLMKKEDLTPEFINKKVIAYVNSLEHRDEYIYKRAGKRKDGSSYAKGDLQTEKINAEKERMTTLLAAVETFDTYQDLLVKNKRYDFADMLLWVIKAFKENAGLLANYQEQFLYVLVDEFQDTSGAQNDVLNLLLDYWESPNIFVVGDEDQSIYRFQGASVKNIKSFSERYANTLQEVILTKNYRSSQHILESARYIIEQSNPANRLHQQKILTAENPIYKEIKQQTIVAQYKNTVHELSDIADQIIALIKQKVEPKEIAVLYKNHQQSEALITYLQHNNIEVNTKRRENILTQPVIKKLITILSYINAELTLPNSGEGYLFELLHYPEFNLPSLEIAKIATQISSQNFNERKASWREVLSQNKNTKHDLFSQNAPENLFSKTIKLLELLIKDATEHTLQELVHRVLNKTGILAYALHHQDSQWNLTLINTFFNYVKSQTAKQPHYNLKNLITDIQLLEENNITIQAERIFSSTNGVNFITTHSSKGLEFEYVFIIDCNSKIWDKLGSNHTYKLPDNLLETEIAPEDESRRLFYVAITRAKKQVQISYSDFDLEEKETEPSRLVQELIESKTITFEQPKLNNNKSEAFLAAVFTAQEPNLPLEILQSAYADELLEKYSLSVTHLNNYLKCPISFYFNNFIKVPAPKSAAMSFGSAVHYALESLFKKMNSDDKKNFHSVQTFLNDFKWFMFRHRESFTEAEFERKMEYAEEFLPKYYNHYIDQWNKVTSIERSYRNIVMEQIPLNGKLDKLEFDGNFVNVVDYKTGQFSNAKSKFNRPNAEKAAKAIADGKLPAFEDEHGGDYWRQAVFYKILMDYDKAHNWQMRTSEFDFVEPDKKTGTFHKEKVAITPEDVNLVKEQIRWAYAEIKSKKFNNGCNKPDCDWCNFSKEFYSNQNTPLPTFNADEINND